MTQSCKACGRANHSGSLFHRHRQKKCVAAAFAVVTLIHLCSQPARSEPLPLPPAEQARVNQAMLQGIIFLRSTQGIDGCWQAVDKPHRLGYAALPALTLLECGMPANHSSVQKAALFISEAAKKEESTYDLALAIMFLDRYSVSNENVLQAISEKKKADLMIESLAYRLIAGQTATGGWGYTCKALTIKQYEQLKKALEAERLDRSTLPAWLKRLPIFQDPDKLMVKAPPDARKMKKKKMQPETPPPPPPDDGADNSNSHFAILALWIAQRHEVPVERTFKLVGKRFRTSQNPDGGWGYKYTLGGGAGSTAAMTCTGLVGLAVERGFTPAAEAKGMLPSTLAATQITSLAGYPSPVNGFKATQAVNLALARETEVKKRTDEPTTLKAFQALGNHVGQPTGRIEKAPLGDLYFLWALERVSMIYDLKTIGDKDWYRWGTEMLLANVKPEGYWDVKTFGDAANEVINSCFALLFLRQANLADDLTNKLRADPSVLDKPIVVKKDPPAEVIAPAAPAAAAPAENKTNPAASPLAAATKPSSAPSSANPDKSASAPTSSESSRQPAPGNSPESPASATSTGSSSAPKEANRLLLWGGGAVGVVLIAAAAVLVIMGLQQKKGVVDDAEPRRSRAKRRAEKGNRVDGESRRPKLKRKEET